MHSSIYKFERSCSLLLGAERLEGGNEFFANHSVQGCKLSRHGSIISGDARIINPGFDRSATGRT